MRVYALNRFRDARRERDLARIRALLADGAEEVGRFEALQRAIRAHAQGVHGGARGQSAHAPAPNAPAPDQRHIPQGVGVDALGWDSAAVGHWLETVGLGKHRQAFNARGVRGRLLLELDDEDLQELHVGSRLERKRILTEISALRGPFQAAPHAGEAG
ncbi:hypothetical protein KFE25_001550 [Diacronema lutheri]|uniref:SAM domain-containing protein n=2 Tax=Diacronema lutheri TaxID=2081491 RepID=A0A8J6C888_DIALT|nr:hypothetical protein KFE25_001550 [Diacronema lutheri]